MRAVSSVGDLSVALVALCLCAGCSATGDGRAPAPASVDAQLPTGPAADQGTADEAYLERYREDLAELHGVEDPPSVEVVRRVAPAEQSALVGACMEERGWPVEVDPEGGVVASVPDQQVTQLNESWYVCWASYPPLEQYLRPLDDEQLGRLYDYYVDELTPCLRAEGHAVDPPSRERWLHDRATGQDWMPYFDVEGAPDEELERRCPASPEDDVLYGD